MVFPASGARLPSGCEIPARQPTSPQGGFSGVCHGIGWLLPEIEVRQHIEVAAGRFRDGLIHVVLLGCGGTCVPQGGGGFREPASSRDV